MGTIRKTTRSAQKKQCLKQNDTFKEIGTKILRTVMTVGFAMSSFIAQDVEAAGNGIVRVDSTTNLMQNGVADIYAEQVSGQVGLNRFQYFDVSNGQTANLYFNQAGSTNYVNTLVNTVQNRIDIGGTVNAIRNNKISGNLYFLSPQGMVIGAGGVVNAGSLTVLTPTQEAFSQYNTVANLNFVDTTGVRNDVAIPINASGTIEVHGTINAATAVELQAGKIDVSKDASSGINPVIKTGVVFGNIVNNSAVINTNQRLQAQVDSNGNVTFTDGVTTGDGSIKLIATANEINDDTNKQVIASVNVGQGATVDAVGDVVINANASHNITITPSTTSVTEHIANTKAEVTIDGKVTGKNVDVQANATSTFNATGLNGIEQFFGGTIETINSITGMMPEKISNTLKDKTNSISQNINSDLLKQANFSYGGADAEAIITINEHADIQAVGVTNNSALIGGNVNVNAESYTLTNIKGALIPTKSNTNGSTSNIDNPYLTLGIVYQENNSNSRVNIKGKIVSYNNLYIGSEAKAENDLALAIKKGSNLTANDAYIKAAIGILNQNANAEVNVGVADNATAGNLLNATGDLDIKSDTQTKINSTVGIQSDLDSMLNTSINIVGGDVSSKVNINDAIQGGNVNITANHLSNGLRITTNNAFDETDGDFVDINNTGAKTNAISNNIKKVKNFVQNLKNKKNTSNNASGDWDQYFDLGASITIDDIANNAEVNINPNADIIATGANGSGNTPALNINAAIKIADKQIKTISILGNKKATSALGVGAAVVVDNLTNDATVNITSDNEKPQIISNNGDVVIASKIDDSYKRTDNMSFTQKINPTNYPNVYVYSGVVKDIGDIVVATGTAGIQNINNDSNVNVGAGAVIRANNKVDISATSIVGNALGAGKVGLPSSYNSYGIGGTVGVQNTNTNSKVIIANDVEITGGQIDINANNDVKNVGVVLSGTKTSSLGITGMVSYMGGASNAEVAVDDDAELTATKEVTKVDGNDVVSNSGQININSENDTTLTNVVGDVTSSGGIGLGASVGVISYDVHSLAQVKNIETVDTSGKGTFSANTFTTEALTDGIINNITVAGTSVGGSKKENSGSNVTVRDNNNSQAGNTSNTTNLQNATVSSSGVSSETSSSERAQNNSSIKIGGAGSVSWNDVHNKTIATVDGVNINLTAPTNATDKTTSLKVQAVDQSYIGAYSGAMALTKAGNTNNTSFSATLSGAVAVNDLVKETSAIIRGSSISNALNIDNIAQNQGAQVAAGLALGLETGNRTNSAGVNVAANGSFNYIDSNVDAVMDGVTITGNTNNVNVDNIAYDKDAQVAGGITAEYAKSKIAAGASIAVSKATNDINAIVRNSNFGVSDSAVNAVNNLAVSKLTQVGSAVSVGFTAAEQNLGVLEAAVAVNNVSNNVSAEIEDSSVVAKNIANKAFDGEVATGITSSIYLQELAGQGFDVYGTDALSNANGSSGADITVNRDENNEIKSNGTYTNSTIKTENNGNVIVGTALGLGVRLANGSYSGTGGAGVVINNVNNDFNSKVSGGSLTVVGDGANLSVESISDTKIIGVAAGVAGSTGNGLTVAGSGVSQTINNDTKAIVEDITITRTSVSVKAESKSNLVSVAGQVSATTSVTGIAGGLTWAENHFDNTTGAYVNGATIKSDTILLDAKNSGKTLAIAATAGATKSNVAEGSYASNNGSNNTEAIIDKYVDDTKERKTIINNVNDLDVVADDESTIKAVAGSIAVGLGKASIGGAVAINTIGAVSNKQDVKAQINNADITTSSINSDVADINVKANNNADLLTLALGGAVVASSGTSISAEGSAAKSNIYTSTDASMTGTTIDNDDSSNNIAKVNVEAISDNDLTTSADALSVSAGSGLEGAVGAAVSIVNSDSDTSATINNSTINAQDVIVQAISNNESMNVAIGLSVAAGSNASLSGAGNVATNNIANDTNVTIAGTAIDASGTVAALADSNEVLRNYGGAASVSATSGTSVALGGTVVVNTITGNTNAIVQNSNIVALGEGDGVSVQDYTITKDDPASGTSNSSTSSSVNGADVAEEMLQDKGTHSVTGSTSTKKGFVVNADAKHTLRDISVTAGVSASTSGVAGALDATVAVNTINGKTSTEVNNTNVNNVVDSNGNLTLNNTANVFVNAYDKVDMQSHIGTLSVGGAATIGAGAATAVDVNNINRETTAKIVGVAGTDLNKNIVNGYNIDVNALGETDIIITESGLAVGGGATAGGAVTGSVSVNHSTSQTNAMVKGIISNAHQFNVEANRVADMQSYNNGAAVSGGYGTAAIGVGVTYVKDESSTNASLYDSNVERIGSIDDSEISVQANNKSSISTEAGSGALAIGLGGAVGTSVGVANMNNTTSATISNTNIGKNNSFDNVYIQANNLMSSNFTNWAAGGGLAGIGVGVGVNTVNSGVSTNVLNSEVYAKNIDVIAKETRNIKEVAVGATVGAVGIGVNVNVLNTNIGTAFADSFNYNVDDNTNKDNYSTEGIVKAVNGALNKATDTIKVLQDKTNTSNVPDNSIKRMDRGSTDGGVQTAIQNSILHASNELEVFNKATTNADIFVFQGGIGIAGVNVSVGVVDAESDLGVTLNNANLKGKVIEIYSENDGNIKADTYQASVGGVDVNVGYGSVTNGGNNQITIDGSTIETFGSTNSDTDDLSVYAINSVDVENIVRGFDVSAAGIDTIISKAIDTSDAKINIGEITGNTFISNDICIEAYNDPHMKAVINNIGGGGLAIRNNIATAKASGKTTLNVDAKNNFDADEVTLAAISGEDKDEDDGTIQGESTKVTTEAHVSGESPAVVGVMVNKARTYNEMETTVNVGAADFYKTIVEDNPNTNQDETVLQFGVTDLVIGAVNSTDSLAQLDKNNKIGGGLTSGSNIAQTNANSTVTLNVDAGNKLHVNTLNIYATNNETIKAIANGGSGGLVNVAPYAAKVENNITATTNLNLVGNVETEDYFIAQALGKTVADLKADAMQASIVGGSGTAVDSVITTISNVNIGNDTRQANITTGGDMVVEAENTINLNRADGFDKMVLANGYGGVDISVAHIGNTVNSNANVNLNNTNILSDGEVDLIAHTNEDLRVNGYVYSTGVLNDSNNKITNNVNNDENIVLNNSKIRLSDASSDLTLSAADDLKLFTYSLSETRFAALGVTTSFVDNNLNRKNKISLTEDSDIFSMQDINLFAGKLVDGNLGKLDLDAEATAFNGSIIPIPINPKVTNDIKQSNVVEIGSSSESTSVRHTNIYADKGLEISRIRAGAYNNYTSSQKTDIVTSLAGEVIKGKTANNHVKIDGRAVAGVASNIKITIGEAGEIVILNSDERNLVSGAQAKPTIKIEADESVGLTDESLKLGTEDYANTLFNRYLELQALMSEYAKDGTNSKSYLGYSAEADRIVDMMVNMGLAVKDSTTNELKMQNSLSVDYIEIPDIEASGGNINVDTSDFYGSGTIQAKGTSEVSIINNTNLLLKVNSIAIDEAGGKLIYNDNVLDAATTDETSVTDTLKNQINTINSNVKNVGFDNVAAETNSEIGINIKGTNNGNIQYSYIVGEGATFQTVIHNVKPLANIQIQGDIINREGSVTISSANNDIVIQGQSVNDSVAISGTSVSLNASKGSIAQGYTDGIVNIGGSVRDEYENKSNTNSTTNASGSYIAGGSVYINAADINVNGIIQSGYADYNVTIDSNVQSRIEAIENNYDGTREISDSTVTIGDNYKIVDGGAYWNATTGFYEYRLNAYYNPATKKIIMEDVDASCGKVYLTGRTSSTGNGQIICLDGTSDVTINNSLNYDMKLGEVLVNDVDGLVSIKDYAKNTLTEISKGQVTVNTINANGFISSSGATTNFDGNYSYNPLENLRYEWTTGTDTTTYTRYKYEEIKALWGLWKPSANTEELSKWIQENLATQIGSGSDSNVPRKEGEVIVVDSSHNDSVYNQTTSSNVYSGTNTKESERYWSTGFLGFNKHHEVIWTTSSGKVTTVHHSVKADNPINVKFIGNTDDNSQITVNTAANLELTGNVGNTKLYEVGTGENISQNYLGNIDITSQNGSIIQTGGNLIGSNIKLAAGEDICDIDILAGDVVNVSAVNIMPGSTDNVHLHSIGLNIKQSHNTKGNVVLGDVGSFRINNNGNYSTGVTANVSINADGDISQNTGKVVAANRIDLSTKGSISGLNVYAGQQPIGLDTLDASVNATAEGNISLNQVDGDMRIGRIYSQSGDVTITVANGSLVDALPYVSQDRGEIDEMVARWESLGIIESADGTDASGLMAVKGEVDNANYEAWDKNALLYAIEDSIVNPKSDQLHTTSSKDPNIIGHNITINVKDSAGFFGDGSKEINITTLFDKKADGTYVNGNALEDLMALSKADASTVSWKTNSSGDKIAVINQVLPVGVQQTVKEIVDGDVTETIHGKLVVESTDSYDSDGFGDIFLEGRNEKDIDNLFINSGNITNDLFVGQLITQTGDVHLSSLGNIVNSASADQVAIKANNLIVSAANGSMGTVDNKLTIKLDGFQGTLSGGTNTIKEGTLSAVASGGIYVDQKVYDLAIKNISSGGDIDLSADKSIFMETINDTDAVNYIRAENNGNITLVARDGSLGKSSAGGRNTNDGIRILNDSGFAASSNDVNVTVVTLKASDDIYVTGVASNDGKTVAEEGPAGVLNLVIVRNNKDVTDEIAPLDNIGINVDGKLNLLTNLETLDKISIYTSDNLELNDNVSARDVYISSGKDLSITNGADVFGTQKVTLVVENDGSNITVTDGDVKSVEDLVVFADKNVNLQSGGINAVNANITAKNGSITAVYDNEQSEINGFALNVTDSLNAVADLGIDLGSKFNQLKNVSLKTNEGALILGNGAQSNEALNVTIVKGTNLSDNIIIHNYDSSQNADDENAVIISGILESSGDVRITNDESSVILDVNQIGGKDVIVNAGTYVDNNSAITARENVIFVAGSNVTNGGNLTAEEDVTFTVKNGYIVNQGEVSGKVVSFEAGTNIVNEAGITASEAVNFVANNSVTNSGNMTAEEDITFEATAGKVANSGVVEGANVKFIAGSDIVNEATVKVSKGINFTAGNNVTNSGNITAEEDVTFTAKDGYIINQGELSGKVVSFEAGTNIVNQAVITASEAVNFIAVSDVINNGKVNAVENVIFRANNNVTNSGNMTAVEDVTFEATTGKVANSGAVEVANVKFIAGTDVVNEAVITASKAVNFTSGNNVTNSGSVRAEENVTFTAQKGCLINSEAISGYDVSLIAKDNIDNKADIVAGYNVILNSKASVTNKGKIQALGGFVDLDATLNVNNEVVSDELGIIAYDDIFITAWKGNIENKGNICSEDGYVVLDAGLVYDTENNNDTNGIHNITNTGNIRTDNGDVTITSHNGNVHNSANIIVQKGNVVISAYQHEGYNGVISSDIGNITNDGFGDIVILSQGNILLEADNNINNTDDFYTVKGDITIKANGNIVNGDGYGNGVIETEFGDVTVTSLNGLITNYAMADLVSGNGNVTLEAKGISSIPGNVSIENHGDLMALGGTITMKSAYGNVINTDDFSTLSDGNGNVSEDYIGIYDADNVGVDIATGNILLSAEKGTLSNNKNLESAENITLIAGDGLDDFAFNIFAGKNITLTATSGNVVNTSVLESYAGDIKLIAENGSVTNGVYGSNTTGDIFALGGSVTLESKGNTTGNLGHVYNYGDIIAIGDTVNDNAGSGSITLKSHYGNVNNYDDFNVASGYETYSYDDVNHGSITSSDTNFNIATSNIILSAANGTIYNDKDYLVALGDITLEAEEGIGNSGELFMAGGNITLSDTDGDLINNSKLISVDGDITLNASNGTVVNMLAGDVFALNGNVIFNAKGDVTNYGDVIALNVANQNNKGSISFVSLNGNVTNYDDFKVVDGSDYVFEDNQHKLVFNGKSGYTVGSNTIKFNQGTDYFKDGKYVLTDSDLTMKALEGYIYNDMAIISNKDVTLVSGKDLTIGTNVASVESKGNVIVQSLNGNVKLQQGSEVLSHDGNIVLDGYNGVDVVEGSTIEAAKGSISVVSTNGAVNVAKMFAGDMANVGSNSGDVIVGEVQGRKVVLFSQSENAQINAQNIKVQDYLVLQGDDVVLDEIDRGSNKGTLNVDVSGVNGGTMKGKLSMDLEGDVRFTTANVTDAEVRVGGKLGMDKVHVAGKGHFYSQDYVTGIYGIAPNHDGSNALYFDFGKGYGPTVSTMLGLNAASFTTDNALSAMNTINYDLDTFAQSGDTFNKHNNGWMNLYVDGSRVQRSNGALLRIDTHYTSYNQRWSAEDLASKQNDFQANYAYDYHFEDRPVLFDRNNLYDIPETVVVPVVNEQADGKENVKKKRVLNFEGDKV